MKKFIIISVVTMIIAIAVLAFLLNKTIQEKNRLKTNQRSLLSEVEFYQTNDSTNVASVEKLTLTNREFEKYNSDLLKTVDDLNLKVKRLQSASQTVIKTEYKVETQIKDSLIYLEGKTDTLRCINYKDKWLTAIGCVRNNQFNGTIESKDTIDQFVHRVPHHIWFIKYGTKAIRQEVISKNPHTKIVYTKYIELKR